MLIGILVLVAVTAAIAGVLGAVWYADAVGHGARTLAQRLGVLPAPPPVPDGPPIERLSRDLGRLRREVRQIPPGTPMARRVGLVAAYDDVLAQACRALAVPQDLDALPEGLEREVERIRLERALVDAGLLREAG
jgi:hypothetical protein